MQMTQAFPMHQQIFSDKNLNSILSHPGLGMANLALLLEK